VTSGLRAPARLGAQRGVRERKSLRDPDGQGPNWTPWSRRDWVSFAYRASTVVSGLVRVAAAGREDMWIRAALRERTAWTASAAARADVLWTWWWELGGGRAGDVVGGTNRVIGGAVVLLAALVVANVVKGLYWTAVDAEARDWAASLTSAGPPRRWSVARRWRRGGVVGAGWAVLLAGLVGGVVGGPWACPHPGQVRSARPSPGTVQACRTLPPPAPSWSSWARPARARRPSASASPKSSTSSCATPTPTSRPSRA